MQDREVELIPKTVLSSYCRLQLVCMKAESLVIADQLRRGEYFSGLVHTARHITKAGRTRSHCANRKEAGA